jgi:hypothetical protein|tara:strand:+ start:592 stop:843 length:252 start_codon:yes stop_codon:yes gene_type:complete
MSVASSDCRYVTASVAFPAIAGTFPPGEDLVEAELRRIFNVGSDETFQSTDVDELKVRLPPTHRSHAYFKGSHKELLVVGELF